MTGDLWCKVFYSKFGGNKDLQFAINSQPYESPLWKALDGVWDHFDQHVAWQIGDGHRINLWMDIWVSNGSLLMLTTTNQLIDSTLMVEDVLTYRRKLDLKFLYNNLPRNMCTFTHSCPAMNMCTFTPSNLPLILLLTNMLSIAGSFSEN
ncbi:hypothetical protein QL285_019551 [Trifolium repens]|nr:hypothetical protein QL285_019551 [Trifolium repens]